VTEILFPSFRQTPESRRLFEPVFTGMAYVVLKIAKMDVL
jgi:hypothetical protein